MSGAFSGSGALLGSTQAAYARNGEDPYRLDGVSAGTRTVSAYTGVEGSYFEPMPSTEQGRDIVPEPQTQQERPSFLEARPADQQHLPAEVGITSSGWIAPAAAGVGVAGMAAVAVEAHSDKDQGEVVMPPAEETPEVPEKSSLRSSPPDSVTVAASTISTEQTTGRDAIGAAAPSTATTGSATAAGQLGGLEREGAHETGTIFPKVIRHDTDMSISQLHIPGKFPKQA
jgi:hypothetical protein